MGKQVVSYDISDAGGELTGTATQGAEVAPLIGLATSANRLTWTQNVTRPMKLTLRFDVTIEGDTMIGTTKAGVLPSSKLTGVGRRDVMAVA